LARLFSLCSLLLVVTACSSSGSAHRATSAPTGTNQAPESRAPNTTVTIPSPLPATNFEQREETPLPMAIQEAAAASAGDRLYVAGGYDTTRSSRADVFVFSGNAWTRGPSLPIAVNHPGAAAIGSDVYVAGGFTPAGATNRAFVLAPGASQWRALPSMKRPRGALALIAIGERLYAIGGRDGNQQIAVPEVYDPGTNAWTDAAAMPAPRNHVAGYPDGAFACVAGGRTPLTSGEVDCLDTARDRWERRRALPVATSGAAAALRNGVLLVLGGEPSDETTLVGVIQQLRSGVWSSRPMLVPRHGTAYAEYRGRLWLCGGATAPGFHAVPTCTSLG
jgi:N-acetylneuraminic acid mutarotase